MRVTVEFEDDTERVFDNALSIHDSIEEGRVTVWTLNKATLASEVQHFPLTDVAAWTTEKA
jgi:hypothetical protein